MSDEQRVIYYLREIKERLETLIALNLMQYTDDKIQYRWRKPNKKE